MQKQGYRCWRWKIFLQSISKNTLQKLKFFIMDFSSKCDLIRSFLRIWSHLLENSLMDNFIFCAVKKNKINENENLLFEFCELYSLSVQMPFLNIKLVTKQQGFHHYHQPFHVKVYTKIK